VKLGATAKCLSSTEVVSGFSSMMDDDDSEVEATLELTKVCKDRGDIGRGVLIDAVESNKRVKD
jgi:hypothetical protein